MKIGDFVTHGGRPCYVRGFDPMSVPEMRVYLERVDTGERGAVPWDEIEPGALASDLAGRTASVAPLARSEM